MTHRVIIPKAAHQPLDHSKGYWLKDALAVQSMTTSLHIWNCDNIRIISSVDNTWVVKAEQF